MVESLNYFIPKQLAEKNYTKAKANIIYAAGAMVGMSVFISTFLYFISHFL